MLEIIILTCYVNVNSNTYRINLLFPTANFLFCSAIHLSFSFVSVQDFTCLLLEHFLSVLKPDDLRLQGDTEWVSPSD